MSDPAIAPGTRPLPLTDLTERWLEVCRDGGAWGYGLLAVGLFRDLRQMRQTWLADLTRTTDRYLRSPAFLELVRLGLRAGPVKPSASTQLE
jgi:hypothetical protein